MLAIGGDRTPEGQCHPHQAATGNTLGPRAEGNVWFFPPNKSTPYPSSWKPGPGASMCHALGRQPQPPHLLPGAQIFSAASKFAASALGNFSRGLLEATTAGCAQRRSQEASTPLSQCDFVGWGFLSPQSFIGFIVLPLGFASNQEGHARCKHGFIGRVFSLGSISDLQT